MRKIFVLLALLPFAFGIASCNEGAISYTPLVNKECDYPLPSQYHFAKNKSGKYAIIDSNGDAFSYNTRYRVYEIRNQLEKNVLALTDTCELKGHLKHSIDMVDSTKFN